MLCLLTVRILKNLIIITKNLCVYLKCCWYTNNNKNVWIKNRNKNSYRHHSNYSLEVVKSLPRNLDPGVYYGWAQVDSGPVYKMVANVGWCPFYQNKEMSVETHVMHKFDSDFYGSNLKISLVGYLRGEKNFSSLDDLIEAIKQDIDNADRMLEQQEAKQLRNHNFFTKSNTI